MVRAQLPLLKLIDEWIVHSGERMSRPEAIRRLAMISLEGWAPWVDNSPARQTPTTTTSKPNADSKPQRSRAAALA